MRLKLLGILFLFGHHSKAQNFDSLCTQVHHIFTNIERFHFNPPLFNYNERLQALDLFIKESDERNIFFLASDRVAMAEKLKGGTPAEAFCEVLRKAFEIMLVRRKQTDSILQKLDATTMDVNSRDTIVFYSSLKERLLSNNLNERTKKMERKLRYDCLEEIVSSMPDPREPDTEVQNNAELQKKMQAFKKRLIKHQHDYVVFLNTPAALARDMANDLCNAILLRCDPHSNFFNATQLQKYQNALSTTEEAFGFSVDEDEEGHVVINDLTPGGPAWKSNNLNEKDIITAYQFEGEKKTEVELWDLDNFLAHFYNAPDKKVTLTVRKKDLKLIDVTITKEKIQSEENVMNSYVVTLNDTRLGYIPIPSFYLDNEEDNRLGCANDVAKEIIKLKKDSVKGILIDLRYNGGGSMREAMSLTGIFIDEGPVAIYKQRNKRPILLKDINRGSIWDGPLVVMVNSGSASASEFVTAALQDYNRAVIVGSTTFGKGSAQNVMMADSTDYRHRFSKAEGFSPYGYLKITCGKFYRVSLQSHQGKGIVPDISIPGLLERVGHKEKDYPYFLSADTVNKKVIYAKWSPLPIVELAAKSSSRINSRPAFAKIKLLGDSLENARQLNDKIPLTLAGYKTYYEKTKKLESRVEDLFNNTDPALGININSTNQTLNNISEYQKKSTESAIDVLKKDIILHEGIYILNDLFKSIPE